MNFSNLQPRQRRFLLEYVSFDLFWSFIGVQEKLKIVQDSWNSVQFYEQFEYTCKYHSILWISKHPVRIIVGSERKKNVKMDHINHLVY